MAGSCSPVFDRAIGPAASASRSNCAVLRGETTFPQVARLEGLEPPAGCLEGTFELTDIVLDVVCQPTGRSPWSTVWGF